MGLRLDRGRPRPLYAALGARVTGSRASRASASATRWSRTRTSRVLATTDVLVSLLPAVPATRRAFDAARIDQLPDHAWFVNVGRGATVDEEALVAALRDGRLGGAALDVTATEPLPDDSPLWDAPNTILTPHVAEVDRRGRGPGPGEPGEPARGPPAAQRGPR
ncbi:NAD(P)-dependent oxidoreductase [Oerskovia sp. M15]